MAAILDTGKNKLVDEVMRHTDRSYINKKLASKGRRALRELDLQIKRLEECRDILKARLSKRTTGSQRKK